MFSSTNEAFNSVLRHKEHERRQTYQKHLRYSSKEQTSVPSSRRKNGQSKATPKIYANSRYEPPGPVHGFTLPSNLVVSVNTTRNRVWVSGPGWLYLLALWQSPSILSPDTNNPHVARSRSSVKYFRLAVLSIYAICIRMCVSSSRPPSFIFPRVVAEYEKEEDRYWFMPQHL